MYSQQKGKQTNITEISCKFGWFWMCFFFCIHCKTLKIMNKLREKNNNRDMLPFWWYLNNGCVSFDTSSVLRPFIKQYECIVHLCGGVALCICNSSKLASSVDAIAISETINHWPTISVCTPVKMSTILTHKIPLGFIYLKRTLGWKNTFLKDVFPLLQ